MSSHTTLPISSGGYRAVGSSRHFNYLFIQSESADVYNVKTRNTERSIPSYASSSYHLEFVQTDSEERYLFSTSAQQLYTQELSTGQLVASIDVPGTVGLNWSFAPSRNGSFVAFLRSKSSAQEFWVGPAR